MRRLSLAFIAATFILLGSGIVPAPAVAQNGGTTTHVVQPGENLFRIALQYNVTVDALMVANGLTDSSLVRAGQVLVIPAGQSLAAAPLTTAPALDPASPPDLGLIGVNGVNPPPPAHDPLAVQDLGIISGSAPPANAIAQAETLNAAKYQPAADPAPADTEPAPSDIEPDPADVEPAPDSEDAQQPASEAVDTTADTSASDADAAPDSASAPPDDGDESAADAGDAGDSSDLGIMADPDAAAAGDDLGLLPADVPEWLYTREIITTGGDNLRAIYERGLALGNNPHAFSKIGDCNSEPPFFLAHFDDGLYDLGPFSYLQPVIDHYAGSFARSSATVWTGNHAWAVFDAMWANPAQCLPGETPIACEFRVNRPSVVLIRLGTNEARSPELFEASLRQIVEFAIDHGTIPVLGTKADHLESGDQINTIIRSVAAEYEVPLWDFNRASETVLGGVFRADGFHLSYYPPDYTTPAALEHGHSLQNLTALLALNAVWRDIAY